MSNADKYRLYFGDLHFHTHYSDNRDCASIAEMMLVGKNAGLSIFGTADHNHNLDAAKWRKTQVETALLKTQYPELLLLNNCEITFLLGHFNVLTPKTIDGTVAEGYRYLYQDPNVLKIINHPYEPTDEWHKRIIPDAAGIEIINGSVLMHEKKQGLRIHSALDIPSVQVYATYLALNLPVAAIGASDAHAKAEMGYGMTGFWLPTPTDSQTVLDAIKSRRTFATTRSDIRLDWSFDETSGVIAWNIGWSKPNSSEKHGFTVEVYRGDQKLQTTSSDDSPLLKVREGAGGEFFPLALTVDKAGLYWIAAFDEDDIAISSPIIVSGAYPAEQPTPQNLTVLTNALQLIRSDLTGLNMTAAKASQSSTVVLSEPIELQIIAGTETPQILDTYGNPVPFDLVSPGSSRIIIDKECGPREFEEFDLWFDRNEIHEYVFANLTYRKVEQTVFLTGRLLPKKLAHQPEIAARCRPEIENIRNIADAHTRFKIHVSTIPSLVINLQLDGKNLPYNVWDDATGLRSMLCYVEHGADCPKHILDRIQGIPCARRKSLQDRIYQIFVYENFSD